MEFKEWRETVEDIFMARSGGFSTEDFPDFDWWNTWNDGASPTEAVHIFLEELNQDEDFSIDF